MKNEISVIINGVRYDATPQRAKTSWCEDNCDLYELCQEIEKEVKDEYGRDTELAKTFSIGDVCTALLQSDKLYFRKVES